MTHDPLCPVAYTEAEIYWRTKCPYCRQIAKVREDMLAKCIAAVETMTEDINATVWVERFYEDENDPEKITLMISLDETLEAMRALLQEMP